MSKNTSIKPEDIIKSYAEYGNDMMNIMINKDIDKSMKRYFNNSVAYIKLQIKVNGKFVNPYIKFPATEISNGIMPPEKRKFPIINVGIHQVDEKYPKNKLGEALRIIDEVYRANMQKLVDDKVISSDKKDSKKSVVFPSVNVDTFKKEGSENQKTGEYKEFDHPRYYVVVPVNKKDKSEPYPFAVKMYDTTQGDRYNKVIGTDPEGEQLNTSNIHTFLKPESVISGTLYLEIVTSAQKINLKGKLMGDVSVKPGVDFNQSISVDEDYDDEMYTISSSEMKELKKIKKLSVKDDDEEEKAAAKDEDDEDDEEEDEEEEEEEDE